MDIKKYFKKIEKTRWQPQIIIFGIIGLISGIWCLFELNNWIKEINGFISLKTANMLFTINIMYILGIIVYILLNMRETFTFQGITKEFDIKSIHSEVRKWGKMSGSFFLGCGTINGESGEKDYYVFYRKGNFGWFKDKIEAYDIEIIEDNSIHPSYKEIVVYGELMKFIFVPKKTIKIKMEL